MARRNHAWRKAAKMGEDLWADDWLQLHRTDLGEWHFIHLTGLGRPCQGDPQRLVCGPGT